MNKVLSLILAMLPLASMAVDSVTVNIALKDGRSTTQTLETKEVSKNTKRLHIAKESIPADFATLDIIADNATASKGEEGFWIFPRGEMGSFKADNGSYTITRNQMPIYGMQNPRETFVAIVKSHELEMVMKVEANNGVYQIFPRWDAKIMGFAPYEDIIIDFVTLEGDDANYSGMGRAYRKYQLDRGKVKPFKKRMRGNKTLKEIATAMPHRIEPHSAIPGNRGKKMDDSLDYTPQTIAKPKPILTFEDSKKFVDAWKAADMTDVHFCDAGWQCGGYDGRCPQVLPIEECVGGESALRDFVKYTQSLGYQICSNSNHTDAYTCSDMWDEDYIAKKPDGGLKRITVLNGGNMYYICIKRSWELFIKKQLQETRDLGYKGVLYIDVFSALPPVECHDKNHPATRREQAEYQNKTLAYAKELFGGSASECGFDHCVENLDYINYLGRNMLNGEAGGDYNCKDVKEWKYNPLIDRVAPLWEIVYHGIVLSNPDKFTQGYLPKGSTAYLRLIEFGGRPIRYSAQFTPEIIARYKEMYDMFQPLKHLQIELMEENRQLAPDVFLTRFGDGSEIVTNYSKSDYSYKDKNVKARDYLLLSPAK